MRHRTLSCLVAAFAFLFGGLSFADDAKIAQEVAAKLRAKKQSKELKNFHIGVKVEDGRVWMKGQVASPQQQAIALDIARRVGGVKLVVNDLSVRETVANVATSKSNTAKAATLRQPDLATAGQATKSPSSSASMSAAKLASAESANNAEDSKETVPAQVQFPIDGDVQEDVEMSIPSLDLAQPRPVTPRVEESGDEDSSAELSRTELSELTGSGLLENAGREIPSITVSPDGIAKRGASTAAKPIATGLSGSPSAQRSRQSNLPRPIRMAQRDLPGRAGTTTGPVPGSVPAAAPIPASLAAYAGGPAAVRYDHPNMPGYAWPSYAAHPNYAAVTYPKQYSATAWPYIGPFYPYPQVPLGWRKVTLEWDDGWWFLDFCAK